MFRPIQDNHLAKANPNSVYTSIGRRAFSYTLLHKYGTLYTSKYMHLTITQFIQT